MGLMFAAIASLFATFNNFAQRRSIDGGGTCKGFVVIQLFTSFCLMLVLNPLMSKNYYITLPVLGLGILGGIIQGLLTWSVGKTLEKGPAGLTFAILCSASIVPALIFFLSFGPDFGYNYTIWNGLGSVLVILGLFWAAKKTALSSEPTKNKQGWAKYMALSFGSHAMLLGYFGFWALVLAGEHPLCSTLCIKENEAVWFVPIMLFIGASIQLALFLIHERRPFKKREVLYGMGGGISHGLCSFFLILAPQKALSWENAMLFPSYAVLIILACNLWAQLIYKEKVHWKANTLAFSGIILGTLGS